MKDDNETLNDSIRYKTKTSRLSARQTGDFNGSKLSDKSPVLL